MSALPAYVEIHVHSIDGYVSAFVQNDSEAVRRLLDHVQPNKIFEQRQLVVASAHSMTVFPCASIARVDLVMDGYPDWEFHFGVSSVQEITEEEFRQRYRPRRDPDPRLLPPGAPVTVFAEIELANGERLFTEIHTHLEARLPLEQSIFFQQLLTAPSLYSRKLGGGAILLNPATIVRLTFYPGPPNTPPNALPAEPLSLEKQ
jgi:hypothetical protein